MGKTRRGTCQGGFTLIEVITVLIIIGILTAVITTRGSLSADANARASELRSQLRYLQLMAMKTGGANYLVLQSTGANYNAFAFYTANSTTSPLLLPGEKSTTVSLSDKDITTLSTFAIAFDSFGIPYSFASNTATKLTASANIDIAAGGQNATISVTPETGYVP